MKKDRDMTDQERKEKYKALAVAKRLRRAVHPQILGDSSRIHHARFRVLTQSRYWRIWHG